MAIRTFLILLACCFISGLPVHQDVPDGVVYTDLHKTVEIGSRVVLKCEFYRTPLAVYWKKGDNPSTAPDLITWAEEEPDSGSCVKDKTCEMGDDYSLIIKNVSIADQGRYICRISNYRGILKYNVTDLKVYATPEGSYPVIQECEGYHKQNCTVDDSTSINITCRASRYFPKIDLLFLHAAQTVTIIKTFELTNADGTKSKNISARAPPSKIPYVCVAFNIPGSQDERTATILVFHQDAEGTSAEESERDKALIIKIVVSVGVSVLGLCIPILLCCLWCRRTETQEPTETTPLLQGPEGPVSSYELWYLASYKKTEYHKEKLLKMFRQLGISDFQEQKLTPLAAYQSLCTWRDGKVEEDQLPALKKAWEDVQYNEAWNDMCDHRKDVSIQIFPEEFEEILQHLRNFRDVTKFLENVTENKIKIDFGEEEAYVREVGLHKLTEWHSNRKYKVNPYVLLSFALESVGCEAKEMMSFWVPGKFQTPIQDHELKEFTIKLTERHCKRLLIYLELDISQSKDITMGNNYYFFDTKKMIADRLRELKCSNYEKRCRLDDAIITIGRYDLQDHFGTIKVRHEAGFTRDQRHPNGEQFDTESTFDDDIPNLAKMVRGIPPGKKTQFQEKTGLNPDDNAEDDTLEERIKKWRDNVMANKSKDQSLNEFRSLRKELNNTKYSELTLTDKEIEDVAADVTSADKEQELMSSLHIDIEGQQTIEEQLKAWRNRKVKPNCRDTLQQALEPFGLAQCIRSKSTTKYVAPQELPRIALDLLMEDVRPIMKAFDIDQNTVSHYVKHWDGKGNCTIELLKELLKNRGLIRTSDRDREDFCQVLRNIGFVDVARSVYFGLYETESQEASSSVGDMHGE